MPKVSGRYVESLSAYARQFLERMDKPDVDEVRGIAPAIAIRQKNSTRNPRSTVGTQTEVYDYLRLLYARVGTTYCRVCGREVYRDSPQSVADEVLETLPAGTRFYVLFPAAAGLAGGLTARRRKRRRDEPGEAAEKINVAQRLTKPESAASTSEPTTTAHIMSLMQRGFTRLFTPTGKRSSLIPPTTTPCPTSRTSS